VIRNTPDLVVADIALPVALTTGQEATIQWTVQNIGGGITNVTYWYDDVFVSTDPNFGSNVVYLGSVLRNAAIGAGGSYTASLTTTIPEDLSAGTYYVQVRTDRPTAVSNFDFFVNKVTEDSAEDNNTLVAGPIEVLLGPTPNLQVTTMTNPSSAFAGRPFDISWTVSNAGSETGNKSWYDLVYLSLDPFLDFSGDRFLGYHEHTGGLAAGASYDVNASFSVPAGYTGVFYVFVVTDSTNRVFERNGEADNVAFNPSVMSISLLPPVDLVVGSIDVPANGTLGANITISYTVSNQSIGTAFGAWDDTIYLSKDGTWDIGDIVLGKFHHVGDVAAGGEYTGLLTAALPGVDPGSYQIIIRTDIRNQILETNEANNIGASLDSVSIDAPELTLGVPTQAVLSQGKSAYYKVTVEAGQTLRLHTKANNSSTSAEMYVSFGAPPSRSTYDLRYPNAFDNEQEIVIGDTEAGTYYVLVYADSLEFAADFFTTTAEVIPFSVQAVDLSLVGNAGSVTSWRPPTSWLSPAVWRMPPSICRVRLSDGMTSVRPRPAAYRYCSRMRSLW
jgi:hypothetical protein